jgi:RNA polymerase sigma factor (sigma-70 family)
MKELELSLRIRNNRLKQRREELGKSPREIAEEIGICYGQYLQYEGLKISPLSVNDGRFGRKDIWKPSARSIAEYYGEPIEELFPDAVLSVQEKEFIKKVDVVDLLPLLPSTEEEVLELPPPADEAFEQDEVNKILHERMEKILTPRQLQVMTLRMDPDSTYQGIGELMGLSKERIRQIEFSALGRLKRDASVQSIVTDIEPVDFSDVCHGFKLCMKKILSAKKDSEVKSQSHTLLHYLQGVRYRILTPENKKGMLLIPEDKERYRYFAFGLLCDTVKYHPGFNVVRQMPARVGKKALPKALESITKIPMSLNILISFQKELISLGMQPDRPLKEAVKKAETSLGNLDFPVLRHEDSKLNMVQGWLIEFLEEKNPFTRPRSSRW